MERDSGRVRGAEDILPHRPPFLFVTRILALVPGRSAVAEFDVPHDLYIFQGHFPGYPILPGVIILEMLAQTGALAILCEGEQRGRIAYLAGVEAARFKRPVLPGDTIRAEVAIEAMRLRVGRGKGTVYVGDEEVAHATVLFAVPKE